MKKPPNFMKKLEMKIEKDNKYELQIEKPPNLIR